MYVGLREINFFSCPLRDSVTNSLLLGAKEIMLTYVWRPWYRLACTTDLHFKTQNGLKIEICG
jgi:hypothetical protein